MGIWKKAARDRETGYSIAMLVVAGLVLTACVTKTDVQEIVTASNADMAGLQFDDGSTNVDERILDFIESNPELHGVNQRLLVRLGVWYMSKRQPSLALAALAEAEALENGSDLNERDAAIVALREHLVWWKTRAPDQAWSATEMQRAEQALTDIDDYLEATELSAPIEALILDEALGIARFFSDSSRRGASLDFFRSRRATLTAALDNYAQFWGADGRAAQPVFLRRGSDKSCPKKDDEIVFEAGQNFSLDIELFRYASNVFCNVEEILTHYGKWVARVRLEDDADATEQAELERLRAALPEPNFMRCAPPSTSGERFVCTPSQQNPA